MTDPFTQPLFWLGLETWYQSQETIYPWSRYTDPYPVWVSETMLQQTTVRTVAKRFEEWLRLFPDAESLARATEGDVLRAWEGLGYYGRARRLREAAGVVSEQGWPQSPEAWQELPGVGPYVAAAVSSFTQNAPVFAFDANLKRVFLRLENQTAWTPAQEREWKRRAEAVFTVVPSATVNAALMRLGQDVCLPQKPRCRDCPLSTSCGAFAAGTQNRIPAPLPQKTMVEEILYPQLFLRRQKELELFLVQSPQGRFQGQWLPPLGVKDWWIAYPEAVPLARRKHLVTHHRWTLEPWAVSGTPSQNGGEWHTVSAWSNLPVPSVYRKILEELTLFLPGLFG